MRKLIVAGVLAVSTMVFAAVPDGMDGHHG
jgi:hypothetical protein